MISLTGLRSFVAVVDTGGIRAAADQIHRTPSAVSMTLKQLELDIGAHGLPREQTMILNSILVRRCLKASVSRPCRTSAVWCWKKRAACSLITSAPAPR